MKTIIFSCLFSVFSLVVMTGCDYLGTYERGNGKSVTTNREVSSFDAISINGNFEVNLVKSNRESVTITTDENLEPYIKTEVTDHQLVLSSQKKLISVKPTKIVIDYRDLKKIDISGATLLRNDDTLEAKELQLNLGGAGVIELGIKTEDLEAQLSGAGLVKLHGSARDCNISLSGAGGLEAYGLLTENCTLSVSGLGGAKVNVKNKLKANIAGVGGIQYIGNPVSVDKNVSGIGSIKEEDSIPADSAL